MRKLHVAVVGLGALGSEVVRYLGLMGTGRVLLVDFDIVNRSNLLYSLLLCGRDGIGRAKTAVLGDAIREFFPSTESTGFCCEIADLGFGALRNVDVILSCVDSDWARLDIAYIARQLSIPVCDGGLGAPDYRHGRISFFPKPASSACYACLLSPAHRRDLLRERDYSAGSCSAPSFSVRGEEVLPGTPMMASMVAALQVDCALRSLAASPDAAYTIRLELAGTPHTERISHPRAASCPFHEPFTTRAAVEQHGTARALLQEFGPGAAIQLDWPICAECRCSACGQRWRPMRRTALVRRLGVCPDCGSNKIGVAEVIDGIGPESAWADTPLSELGLPDHHLHAVVEAGG